MFGGVKEGIRPKDLVKPSNIINYVIMDHSSVESEDPYYIFLLDKILSEDRKQIILKKIQDAGYTNYKVLIAVNCKYNAETLKGDSIVDFIIEHSSDWKKDLNAAGHCRAIMSFGCAMYNINKSASLVGLSPIN